MQIAPQSEDASKAQRVRRMLSSFKVLNARIARLALGLGVSLKSDADVAGLMKQHQMSASPHEHLLTPDRMNNQWKELRGLLVLRYGILTSYVDQVGLSVTRKILVEAEHDLLLRGFNLGDDGISLKFLF
jgi:hypothetical protein